MSIDRGNENKYKTTVHGKVVEGQYKPKENKQKVVTDYIKSFSANDIQTYFGFLGVLHKIAKKIYPPYDLLALAIIALWLTSEVRENYPLSMSLVVNEAIGTTCKFIFLTFGLWLLCKHVVNDKMGKIKEFREQIKLIRELRSDAYRDDEIK